MIEKLSLNFDKLVFLNLKYLEFYLKNKKILSESFDYNLHSSFKLPINSEVKNFNNTKDFEKFLENRSFVAININNFGTNLPSLRLLMYLNKFEISHIEINDISNIKIKQKIEINYFLKGLKFKINKIFYIFAIYILSKFNLIKKVEIKFTAKKKNFFFEKYDYMKFTNVINEIISIARRYNKKIVVDTQVSNRKGNVEDYSDIDLISINDSEARDYLKDWHSNDETIFLKLCEKLKFDTIIFKLGAKGLIAKNMDKYYRFPALPVNVIDPIGSGDAFLSCSAICNINGIPFEDNIYLSSCCAALCCTKLGTSPIDKKELKLFSKNKWVFK